VKWYLSSPPVGFPLGDFARTSENAQKAKFAEFPFHALG
jgi:hypothetical protein